MKRALSAVPAETLVLGSSEKLNAASPYLVAPIQEVSGILVASGTGADVLAPLVAASVAIMEAP